MEHTSNNTIFNEAEWLKLLFLLSDTQSWINDMEKQMFYQLPIAETSKLFRKTFYLTATALAHIIERHYDKTRHPCCGKFTIPVIEIVNLLRRSFHEPCTHLSGTLNYIRTMNTGTTIGFDKYNQPTGIINIITNPGGEILTAFPGQYQTGANHSSGSSNVLQRTESPL